MTEIILNRIFFGFCFFFFPPQKIPAENPARIPSQALPARGEQPRRVRANARMRG